MVVANLMRSERRSLLVRAIAAACGAVTLLAYAASVAAEPKSAKEPFVKGKSFFEKNDFDWAIAAFTEAIRFNPHVAEAYFDRGFAYQMKGEKANAEEDFEQAKKLGYKAK